MLAVCIYGAASPDPPPSNPMVSPVPPPPLCFPQPRPVLWVVLLWCGGGFWVI